MKKNIWTIGHSNHTLEVFIQLLKSFDIQLVADIRRYPGSRKFPYFNKSELKQSLQNEHIQYLHFEDLGGRRKPKPDSQNDNWRNDAFRGFADYLETNEFHKAINYLMKEAKFQNTAIMCSEVLWWRCHRSIISDYLKSHGWKVMHIMGINKSQEHPYTSAAHIVEGKLNYHLETK